MLHMDIEVLCAVYKKSLSVGVLKCGECIPHNSLHFEPCINRLGICFGFFLSVSSQMSFSDRKEYHKK